MSLFGFLKRKSAAKKQPLPPIRTIRQPGAARAKNQARLAAEFEESGAYLAQQKAEDQFMDTGSLEVLEDTEDLANPYETHSWQKDPEQGLRRIDDQNLVNRKNRKEKITVTSDNPYDTSVMKKGWK